MRTYAGIGLVILAEVATLASARLRWLPGRARDRSDRDVRTLIATLEIEDADAPLPAGTLTVPRHVLSELAADPMLGLADVRVQRQVRPAARARYGPGIPGSGSTGPNVSPTHVAQTIPAVEATWLELRLALPGSRDGKAVRRAAGPIAARGGGRIGAGETLDKAARTAAARLATAGFSTSRLSESDTRAGFVVGVSTTFPGGESDAEQTSAGMGTVGIAALRARRTNGQPGSRPRLPWQHRLSTRCGQSWQAWQATEPLTSRPANPTTAAATDPLQIAPSGLPVGHDPADQPVALSLFRRSPLTVTVIGGLPLVQILALRAAGQGARILVETGRPADWESVRRAIGTDPGRFRMQAVGTALAAGPAASAADPLLVIRDSGARPPYSELPRGPWTAVLTLLPFLDPRAGGQLTTADVVGCQRITPRDAGIVGQILGLAERDAATLSGLAEHAVWWRARTRSRNGIVGQDAGHDSSPGHVPIQLQPDGHRITVRHSRVTPSAWESAIVGPPAGPQAGPTLAPLPRPAAGRPFTSIKATPPH